MSEFERHVSGFERMVYDPHKCFSKVENNDDTKEYMDQLPLGICINLMPGMNISDLSEYALHHLSQCKKDYEVSVIRTEDNELILITGDYNPEDRKIPKHFEVETFISTRMTPEGNGLGRFLTVLFRKQVVTKLWKFSNIDTHDRSNGPVYYNTPLTDIKSVKSIYVKEYFSAENLNVWVSIKTVSRLFARFDFKS